MTLASPSPRSTAAGGSERRRALDLDNGSTGAFTGSTKHALPHPLAMRTFDPAILIAKTGGLNPYRRHHCPPETAVQSIVEMRSQSRATLLCPACLHVSGKTSPKRYRNAQGQ